MGAVEKWEIQNQDFPLSHRREQPAAHGRNHFKKTTNPKAIYTKHLTPPFTGKLSARPAGKPGEYFIV
jgi:hypothetical protein